MRFPGFGNGMNLTGSLRKIEPVHGKIIEKDPVARALKKKTGINVADPLELYSKKKPPPETPKTTMIRRTPDLSEAARLRRLAEPNRRGQRAPLIGGATPLGSSSSTARLGE